MNKHEDGKKKRLLNYGLVNFCATNSIKWGEGDNDEWERLCFHFYTVLANV
jgi:hypothetical protein